MEHKESNQTKNKNLVCQLEHSFEDSKHIVPEQTALRGAVCSGTISFEYAL